MGARHQVRARILTRTREVCKVSNGRVALLLRKSKVVEEGTDALSIEAQEAKGRTWAAREGLDVVAVYRENLSGYKDIRRPKLERALGAMERGEFGSLWCAAMDRLSRRGAIAVAGILANGGRFVFDWERLDSADPRDLRLILWRAEDAKEYSDRLSHNVRATKDQMRDAGAWVGAAPYGTRVTGKRISRRLVPDPATWPVVVRIYEESANGISARKLAAKLSAEGIPSPSGGTWRDSSIRRIVMSPAYEGWMVVVKSTRDTRPVLYLGKNGEPVRAFALDAEPISAELAAKARDARAGIQRGAFGPRPGVAAHMLTGLLRCAGCGARMPVMGRSYVCGSHAAGKPCPAPASVLRSHADMYVGNRFFARMLALDPADDADQILLAAMAVRWAEISMPQETAEVRAAKDAARAAEAALARHADDESRYPGAARRIWERRLDELAEAYNIATRRAERLAPAEKVDVSFLTESDSLDAAWQAANVAEKRAYLSTAITTVTVCRASRRGAPWDGDARVHIAWADTEEDAA